MGEQPLVNRERERKDKELEAIRQKLETTTDRLGAEIEEGIKEVVVGLNVMGLTTVQSCEGHPDSSHGYPYPWVMIEAPGEPEESHVGEKELCERFAREHGVDAEQLLRAAVSEEVWFEFQEQIEALPELTPEFITWREANRKLYERAIGLLEEFYFDRTVSLDVQVRAIPINEDTMVFQLRSNEKLNYEDEGPESALAQQERQEALKKLKPRRDEMEAFADFLKNKFLNS